MRQLGGQSRHLYIHTSGMQESAQTTGGGRAGRKPFIRGKLGENVQKINFKSMAKIGLGIRLARMNNEAVGSYTENRLRQRRVNQSFQMLSYAVGISKFKLFGLAYAGGDLGYRVSMSLIDQQKKNREANMLRDMSGISARSGSRYSGSKL